MAAATPESRVKKRIKDALVTLQREGYPVWYYMPVPGRLSAPGIPDFICCINGFFLAIEAKAPGGTTTLIQDITIDRIRAANGHAIITVGADTGPALVCIYNLAGKSHL